MPYLLCIGIALLFKDLTVAEEKADLSVLELWHNGAAPL